MNKLVKGLVLGSIAAVSATAFAAPKMGGDMYGIAGVGLTGLGVGSASMPVNVELGVGKKVTPDVSVEVATSLVVNNLGSSCFVPNVAARGIYHVPVDLSGIKPYVGAGAGVGGVVCRGVSTFGFSGFHATVGAEYPMSNTTKLYIDFGGVANSGWAWGGSAGVKMGF